MEALFSILLLLPPVVLEALDALPSVLLDPDQQARIVFVDIVKCYWCGFDL